jgi:glycosyltransferase involved in cell wall biosynthesis
MRMRVTVVHNLKEGGARRRLSNQMAYMTYDIVEVCLETATPIRSDATVVPLRQRAPSRSRLVRPPLRYLDLATLVHAWHRAADTIRSSCAEVVYLNPCRYLQAPPVVIGRIPPSLYFCDETRRVDNETTGQPSRNQSTATMYGPLYAAQRNLDRRATSRASRLATNSRYTASEIARVYHRGAEVVTLGVAESLLSARRDEHSGPHLLSVGALVRGKGHDLALRSVAMTSRRRPVIIVAPRPDPVEEARLCALATEVGVDLDLRIAISDIELAELYGTAQATLYLAQREPLGLASLEAQACGSPVIVADEGGLPETIIDGITGWKAPRDPAMIAKAIDLLEDTGIRDAASVAAAAHGRQWSWPASAKAIERLLGEVYATAR